MTLTNQLTEYFILAGLAKPGYLKLSPAQLIPETVNMINGFSAEWAVSVNPALVNDFEFLSNVGIFHQVEYILFFH